MTTSPAKQKVKRSRLMKPERRKELCRRFGEHLQGLRVAKGLSYIEFYHRSGIDPGNLRKYESGKREPGLVIIMIMAKALGASDTELLKFKFDMSDF